MKKIARFWKNAGKRELIEVVLGLMVSLIVSFPSLRRVPCLLDIALQTAHPHVGWSLGICVRHPKPAFSV